MNAAVVSTQTATYPQGFYSVGVALQANQKITVRQRVGGDSSIESNPIVVQSVPTTLTALTIQTNVHTCGRAVLMVGALPGEKVEASINNQIVGTTAAISGYARIFYNPPLHSGQNMVLKQTACNNATASQSANATDPTSPLLPVQIQLPLIECQNSITISGVVDGAYVELWRNGKLEQTFTHSISSETWWIKPLVLNDQIKSSAGL